MIEQNQIRWIQKKAPVTYPQLTTESYSSSKSIVAEFLKLIRTHEQQDHDLIDGLKKGLDVIDESWVMIRRTLVEGGSISMKGKLSFNSDPKSMDCLPLTLVDGAVLIACKAVTRMVVVQRIGVNRDIDFFSFGRCGQKTKRGFDELAQALASAIDNFYILNEIPAYLPADILIRTCLAETIAEEGTYYLCP